MTGITEIMITAAITGAISTAGTVVALRVHISYLREAVTDLKQCAQRAHDRIDRIERA